VAIKVISSPTPSQQKNFVKDLMILNEYRHPNIMSFLGASIQDQHTLLVMEFMPEGDLYTRIQNDVDGRYTWYQR